MFAPEKSFYVIKAPRESHQSCALSRFGTPILEEFWRNDGAQKADDKSSVFVGFFLCLEQKFKNV